MPDLTRAHRGYEYQDLLVACRLVDTILETLVEVHVDEKLVSDDRFDDLTTRDVAGVRERTQIKHTERERPELNLRVFTSEDRGLRLDKLVASACADRDGPGKDAAETRFRVVMCDALPTDPVLAAVLVPAGSDVHPFLEGVETSRFRFDVSFLWPLSQLPAESRLRAAAEAFAFLRAGETRVERADLEWVCDRLVIELAAPPMSRDLREPGPAERVLLSRVQLELGAGLYPNEHRSAVDVAEALTGAARAARMGDAPVTRSGLLRRAQLRHDFGAVARAHPVDVSLEIRRDEAVRGLAAAAQAQATDGGTVLTVGPPGQGKSWICQQLVERLIADGWLVAEHYCYLGDADGDRQNRVMIESVFGSLLGRVADADPRVVTEQRPRFAADEQALVAAVENALRLQPGRRVALIADGLDHVTRVRGRRSGAGDPSFVLAEALSVLQLPPDSVLVVLSQPGSHLQPLEVNGAQTVAVPALTEVELRELAQRLGVVPTPGRGGGQADAVVDGGQAGDEFLAALAEMSAGNALYATYLCREVSTRPSAAADATRAVRALPAFDGTLEHYYAHLRSALAEGVWVADVIALLDVPVTRDELREIMPGQAYRVDEALRVLRPVLAERASEGGVRVYHESFARYLRRPFQDDITTLVALLNSIAGWLTRLGLFTDLRAFRALLSVLADAGRDADVIGYVGHDFVTRSVAAGFPASMTRANLATALRCAARSEDWGAVARCVDLSRAAETYQHERFDSTLVEHADVPIRLLGAQALADRLLLDGRPVMPGRAGLQMCAALDEAGAVAPWPEYLEASRREAEADNTSYGRESDQQVQLAVLRGRLRLAAGTGDDPGEGVQPDDLLAVPPEHLGGTADGGDLAVPLALGSLAAWLERERSQSCTVSAVRILLDIYGLWAVVALIWHLDQPGMACLTLAEAIVGGECSGDYGSALRWAAAAAAHGLPPGNQHRLLALGLDPEDIAGFNVLTARKRLLDLTSTVQQHDIQLNPPRAAVWLDLLALAARRDPLGLNAAEALITSAGWYPCWLRFAVSLARAEAGPAASRSRLACEAIGLLTAELDPFAGDPRSCDLYSLQGLIEDAICRAVVLLNDADWDTGLRTLSDLSARITTTLRGAPGGPLPPDTLLSIATRTATPARISTAEAIVRAEMETRTAGRYYSDLAGYRLTGARVALATGDHTRAEALWAEACQFLTAYGFHKDITIYELLDPLPALIDADPQRGRVRVSRVQPLCERVPNHTDQKETHGAWRRWWELLAQADPARLADLAVPPLLAEANEPNWLLDESRLELWRQWHNEADPVVAGALRLTLETPLDPADPAALKRLAEHPAVPDGHQEHLFRMMLSRADERACGDSTDSDAASRARDDGRVDELNQIAAAAGAPRIHRCPLPHIARESDHHPATRTGPAMDLLTTLERDMPPCLPPGHLGLTRAIRSWHAMSYDDRREDRVIDRYASMVGYRLIELADSGRGDEASAVLDTLCGPADYPEGARLLSALAEGFERHGRTALAARAHALTWTRSRGGGGWLSFGGETALENLRRATALDATATAGVIADEAERAVSTYRYGTNGITQALIFAFASAALHVPSARPLDVAFSIWDEACAVIEYRAPRTDASDDPDRPYTPPDPDPGGQVVGDLDAAFALASIGGLGHAWREAKRRSLLAVQALIVMRPTVAAPAIATALARLSDPAALTWLLCLLEHHAEEDEAIVARCTPQMQTLAQGPHLAIRATARRLLPANSMPSQLGPSDASLLGSTSSLMVTEPQSVDRDEVAESLVSEVAGARLLEAEPLLRGLADAVLARVRRELHAEEYKARLDAQRRAYFDRVDREYPDAYLAPEQTAEEALQRTAAGGRAARLAAAMPIGNPASWEDRLADAITDNPRLPLELEATRHPRPRIPPPPGPGHPYWEAIAAAAQGSPPGFPALTGAKVHGTSLAATTSIMAATSAPTLVGGPYDGWRIIAAAEGCHYPQAYPDRGHHTAIRYAAIEIRADGDHAALDVPPFAEGDIRTWKTVSPSGQGQAAPPLADTQPLLGIDRDLAAARDAASGLGLPAAVLTPTAALITLSHLDPGPLMTMADSAGPCVALITWRTCYKRSRYHLARPRMTGCAVVLRPDLLTQLDEYAHAPLSFREYISGDRALAPGPGD